MKITGTLIFFLLVFPIYSYSQKYEKTESQSNKFKNERLSLDKGWKFYLGDIPFPEIKGHNISYTNAKAGTAWGAASPVFDDKSWRILDLPHDWAIELPYDSNANVSQGYKPRGTGWYRRNFKVDTSERGKHFELQFDGIATYCTVWFNGTLVHRNWCGYTSFYIDITPMMKYGNEINNVAIRVDANAQEGWWYEGAGIYRHTWLVKRPALHITTNGVYANPVKKENNWLIPIEITMENSGKVTQNAIVEVSLIDDNQNIVNTLNKNITLENLNKATVNFEMNVKNPKLWSVDKPTLYKVKTVIKQNENITDELITACGFRTIEFKADSGFYLNGKNLKIKGVCNHQDAAGLGVAVPNSIWSYKIRKLKGMGVNAYRCAHNPPSAEFLDACDSLGIMVMDENRNFNSSPEYINQLKWMIQRDRNHPSIILWSVFNEEPMQGKEIGYEMVRRLKSEVKKLDTTRPVTAAMSGGQFEPVNVSQAVDVVGFNYNINDYDRFHKEFPELPMTSSEDVSGLITRGEYVTDKNKHTFDSYDSQYPDWGCSHRTGWKTINERNYIAGCFIWTGFDYLGEPNPYSWQTVSSSFGIMDICGFPKSAYYLHKAQWSSPEKPVLQIIPHWNWPKDSTGKNIKVMVFSNTETVKIKLNGKVIDEKKVDIYEMPVFNIPYHSGKLEAIGFNKGEKVISQIVETTSEPIGLQLIPERQSVYDDGWDAITVTVQSYDAKGRQVPTANLPVEFEISGDAKIIGVANGNPNSHEPEKSNKRNLFNGLAQVTIQTIENAKEPVILTAKSKGLKSATVIIKVIPKQAVQTVPVIK